MTHEAMLISDEHIARFLQMKLSIEESPPDENIEYQISSNFHPASGAMGNNHKRLGVGPLLLSRSPGMDIHARVPQG